MKETLDEDDEQYFYNLVILVICIVLFFMSIGIWVTASWIVSLFY